MPAKFKTRNKELSDKFGVQGYPTYILFDSEMKNKIGKLGSGRDKTPASFAAEIEDLLRTTDKAIEAKAKELGAKAGEFRAAFAAIAASKEELDKWIDTRPQRTKENEKLFEGFKAKIAAAKAKFNSYF